MGLTVVALGGNALLRKGERGTAAEQRANLASTFQAIAPLLRDGELVLTHGNGPQVGNELLRQELGAAEAPPLPLYLAVAQTQAEIGALIAAELPAVSGREAVVLLTRVVVAADDPAFDDPTKPVGPFYDEAKARELESERGWTLTEDSGRGWRRVVPSPKPVEVLELESIRSAPRRRLDRRRGGRRRDSGRAARRAHRRRRRRDRQGPGLRPPRRRPRRRAPPDPHAGRRPSTAASRPASASPSPSSARAGTTRSSPSSPRGACGPRCRPRSTS